ncbi:MAG: biopolymer transporter ExbD [Nostocaceae cyanobacterium]|nr:biopolymer transporter ExbD [Nostocaceae cyanobacterium]
MRLPDEPEPPLQINVVPLIDVMFALLTFFIVSSLSLTRSEGLPVNLPKAVTAQQQESTEITVSIDAQGNINFNQQPIAIDALANQVRSSIGDNEALVIIKADAQVSHGQVVAVMDRLRQVKGVRLAIATEQP